MCIGKPGPNSTASPCYDSQAEDGETACFSWAGWGGPCTEQTQACMEAADCVAMEECLYLDTAFDLFEYQEEYCTERYGATIAALFWAYQQCIFCDVCDIACAEEASHGKHCDEYTDE